MPMLEGLQPFEGVFAELQKPLNRGLVLSLSSSATVHGHTWGYLHMAHPSTHDSIDAKLKPPAENGHSAVAMLPSMTCWQTVERAAIDVDCTGELSGFVRSRT